VQVKVQATLKSVGQTAYSVPVLPTNVWTLVTIPLQMLGVAGSPFFDGLQIKLVSAAAATFYVDDLVLVGIPLPSVTNVTITPTARLNTVDVRHFGINAAAWDSLLGSSGPLLQEGGFTSMRFPGGSSADDYDWTTGKTKSNGYVNPTSFASFATMAISINATVFLTVNYGSGTPQMAASWVAATKAYNYSGFRYFEVGNENYGSWETDNNNRRHDPVTYATRFIQYITQMKAVNPAIKVGAVAIPYEDSYANYNDQAVVNPRTGVSHSGWTPVMLAAFKRLGQYPDFIVYHRYPEEPGSECDSVLLQAAESWKRDAADLRQQLTDYIGAAGAGIELVVTENNAISYNPGKQSTSLVDALYMADSIGSLLYTELKGQLWWDLRNWADGSQNNDPLLYGWRKYGDYGVLSTSNARYPTFYASKILKNFLALATALCK